MARVKFIPGLFAFLRMKNERQVRIRDASREIAPDPISTLAEAMHPGVLKLTVTSVTDENESMKTYRLQPSENSRRLPLFQAGQYLSVKMAAEGGVTSRAYTISSAPFEAESAAGFYEISVRKKPGGFVSGMIWDLWKPGTAVTATGPHGDFYYLPLRDSKEIVALAGGAGITPFRSMMKQFAREENDIKMILLYGCKDEGDLLFAEEFDELCRRFPHRFNRINTYEDPGDSALRRGYIDAQFIKENVPLSSEKTFLICGPAVMYEHIEKELEKLGGLERKQMRFELDGQPEDVMRVKGFPAEAARKNVKITVHIGKSVFEIPAKTTESLLVAIERSGLTLDSRCRSGECGICRSKLVSGKVFILPDHDGRRAADRELGYIHPCSTYPLTEVSVIIPPGKETF